MFNFGSKPAPSRTGSPGVPKPGASKAQAAAITYAVRNKQAGGQSADPSPLFAALMGSKKASP